MVEGFVEPRAFLRQHTVNNLNARPFQNPERPAAMLRIRINGAGHNSLDPGGTNGLGAGRRATMRGARLQCHVKRRAFDLVPVSLGLAEGLDFRMGFSGAMMPAPPDDSVPFHQDRPYHWVGRSRPIAPAGQAQSQAHILAIPHLRSVAKRCHSPNNAPANCFASNGCRSSACSPRPMNLIDRKSTRLNSSHLGISYAV